jgi:hypothetical protein
LRPTLSCIIFLLITNISLSQIVKFKATSLAFKDKNEITQEWSDWSDWEEVDVLMLFDIEKDRIKIFSKEEQVYDIIQNKGSSTDSDGDETLEWLCVNEDGLKCGVRLVNLISQDGNRQIYIDFSDFIFVYNIYLLD